MVDSFPSPPFPSLLTHTVNKCLFCDLFCASFFFLHIFMLFWGVITVYKLALKCSGEGCPAFQVQEGSDVPYVEGKDR